MSVGLQSQNGSVPDFTKVIAKHPTAWLLLGNAVGLTLARDIRSLSPDTIILIRGQADNWSLDAGVVDFANRSMKIALPFLNAGVCDFLLPPNEPVVNNDVDAKRLNDQMVQIAGIYKANGFKTGAYTNPVGNPPYELLHFLRDGILACDGWWFTHQYGAPTLQANSADLSLRHRKASAILAIPNLKIGILECGIDLGIGRNPPDGLPTGGGYRNLPDNGHLIEDYLAQLDWWTGELAKDSYVKLKTIYGYSMNGDWATFDVAAVDTDREKFINWLSSGTIIPPTNPPPIGDHMTTPQERIDNAWKSINVVFNPQAAFYKKAQQLGLGRPVANEIRYVGAGGSRVALQGYEKAFLETLEDHYALDEIKAFDWLTGLEYVPSVTPPNTNPPSTGIPPYSFPQTLTDYGALGEEGKPISGKPFYRLTGASVSQGVSANANVEVFGKNAPAIGVQVVSLRPDGKGEVLQTGGDGSTQFNFGAASAFTSPGQGPFTIFVAEGAVKDGDSKLVTWKNILSDKVLSLGDFQGQHSEFKLQFVQV